VRANVNAMARRADVSPPTIIRFCRALGFAGLREFKLHLAQSLAVGTSTLHRAVGPGDDMLAVAHKVLQGAASALANLEQHISPDDVERAVTRIAKAQKAPSRETAVAQTVPADPQARWLAGVAPHPAIAPSAEWTAYANAENERWQLAGDLAHREDAVLAGNRRRCEGAGGDDHRHYAAGHAARRAR